MQIRPVIKKSDSIHAIGSTDNNKIWHHHYGHLSERTLNMTQKHVCGLVLNPTKMDTCHDCIAAKITCRPFPKTKEPRERRALDLMHMDIDVMHITGRSNENYILFLTDDYSGYRFGFPIVRQTGSEILNCLLSIIPYMERQTGNMLKAI
jgi:hypothetical protein